MPARRQAFLSRPRETIFVLCLVQEGARNPNSAPPPAMVIGVQPFEVWRAPVLLHSPRPHRRFSLSSFSLFLSSMLRGVSGILKFYGVDLESREKSRPLITRSRVNSHEGGPTAIKLEKLATLLFQRVKKDGEKGRRRSMIGSTPLAV